MTVITKIQVSGMTCTNCVNSITKEIQKMDGIDSVQVSLLTEEATIEHESNLKPQDIIEKIDDIGFEPKFISSIEQSPPSSNSSQSSLMTSIIQVGGMTCSSCSNSIKNQLIQLNGVKNADVSLLTEEATVLHDSSINVKDLVDDIDNMGFDATLISSKESSDDLMPEKFASNKQFKTELRISGMTCSACVNTITTQLQKLEGVTVVSVSLITEKAFIIHDETLPVDIIKDSIEDMGFEPTILEVTEINGNNPNDPSAYSQKNLDVLSVTLKIFGMADTSSADIVEQSILSLQGIINCQVSFSSEEARIQYNSNIIGVRDIIYSVNSYGFDAILSNKLDSTSQIDLLSKISEIRYWRSNFLNLLKIGIPVVILGHILPIIRKSCQWNENSLRIGSGLYIDIILQLILGTYIQFWLGKQFYINCYKSLTHGSGNMDVLICFSTSIIYSYSIFSIVHAIFVDIYPNVLFDTSAMLFLFVSLGKWAESKAKGNTSTSLSKLLSLTPSSCTIIKNPEIFFTKNKLNSIDPLLIQQETVSIDLLQRNDITVILPGAKIPADGLCVFGESEADESLLTGESLPIGKKIGSKLIGGSVNLTSILYMKVTSIGEQTELQQIVKLVKDAQISNAPVQRFADKIASIFVPSILIFSFITLTFWTIYVYTVPIDKVPSIFLNPNDSSQIAYFKILQVAISVIVVACPCALGLAAPTAVMVGTGVGATNGVLIKGGEILEKASSINCVIFDKTGTLTKGIMEVTNYKFSDLVSEDMIWALLYAIELNSEHPIAKAIVKECNQKYNDETQTNFELQNVETHAGLGIAANLININSKKEFNIKLGNAKFLKNFNISNNENFIRDSQQLSKQSKICSIAYVLLNGEYSGFIEVSDSLKPDAKSIVNFLLTYGYSIGMVTGDSVETSTYVANVLGIPLNNVLAEASPEQKLDYISSLQEKHLNVAFVGDGINDAPALVQSDVGIAIATGTDIAMSAADIVLLASNNEESSNTITDDSRFGLLGIYASLDISRATFNTIKVNFLLAVIYNMIMLPIAMGCLIIPFSITMHPMFASAAMACSSVSVVGNSLTLKHWSLDKLKRKVNNLLSNMKNINSSWYDDNIDERSSINVVSTEYFIVTHKHNYGSIPVWKRFFSFLKNKFKRNNSYSNVDNC